MMNLVKSFNSKKEIDIFKEEVSQTIEFVTSGSLTLIIQRAEISKNGNLGIFTFEVYLNGAKTKEQESLDTFIYEHNYPNKDCLFIGKNGCAYALWGYLPYKRGNRFIIVNLNDFNEQIFVTDSFVRNFFSERSSVKPAIK